MGHDMKLQIALIGFFLGYITDAVIESPLFGTAQAIEVQGKFDNNYTVTMPNYLFCQDLCSEWAVDLCEIKI
jgi:hypothetical protein